MNLHNFNTKLIETLQSALDNGGFFCTKMCDCNGKTNVIRNRDSFMLMCSKCGRAFLYVKESGDVILHDIKAEVLSNESLKELGKQISSILKTDLSVKPEAGPTPA